MVNQDLMTLLVEPFVSKDIKRLASELLTARLEQKISAYETDKNVAGNADQQFTECECGICLDCTQPGVEQDFDGYDDLNYQNYRGKYWQNGQAPKSYSRWLYGELDIAKQNLADQKAKNADLATELKDEKAILDDLSIQFNESRKEVGILTRNLLAVLLHLSNNRIALYFYSLNRTHGYTLKQETLSGIGKPEVISLCAVKK